MSTLRILWLVGWAAWIGVLTVALWKVRAETFATIDDPQALAEWEEFREAARRQSGADSPIEGPVKRQVPRSAEPPQWVLLRDYFGTCVAAAWVFGTVLYGTLVFLIRGALCGTAPSAPADGAKYNRDASARPASTQQPFPREASGRTPPETLPGNATRTGRDSPLEN